MTLSFQTQEYSIDPQKIIILLMQGEGKGRKSLFVNALGNYHKGLPSPKFAATLSKLKYAKLFRVLM